MEKQRYFKVEIIGDIFMDKNRKETKKYLSEILSERFNLEIPSGYLPGTGRNVNERCKITSSDIKILWLDPYKESKP